MLHHIHYNILHENEMKILNITLKSSIWLGGRTIIIEIYNISIKMKFYITVVTLLLTNS